MTDRQRGTTTSRVGRGGELGVANPTRVGSTLYEDFLPQLRGKKAATVYEEMAWNDATVGAILYAVEQLVRQVQWTVESEDETLIEWLNDILTGMDHSWDDFISAALTELIYGWSMFEVVYDLDEGKVVWRKFGFRSQSSLHKWILDDKGELEAFEQTMTGGGTVVIPAEKLVHFRTTVAEGRPEGRSWLRRAYRAWYFKKRVEDITTIGIERDLNGVPMMRVPAETLMAGPGDDEYDASLKIVTGLKVDELTGLMIPSDLDPETNERLFDLELLSTSGRGKTDPLQFIRTQAMDIASVMLAQFIGLGRDTVGSRALAEPQQELFQTALGALLDSIEEQFHRQGTQRLLELNGEEPDAARISHGEVRDIDLEALSNYVLRIAQAGGEFFGPDGEGMDEFRQLAGLQPMDAIVIEDAPTEEIPDEGQGYDPSPYDRDEEEEASEDDGDGDT